MSTKKPNNNIYEKNVLFITDFSSNVLYNILLEIKKVNITIFDAYDLTLDNKNINFLNNFDLVVTDFIDAGYNLPERTPNFIKNLNQYVKEGGALFSSLTNLIELL